MFWASRTQLQNTWAKEAWEYLLYTYVFFPLNEPLESRGLPVCLSLLESSSFVRAIMCSGTNLSDEQIKIVAEMMGNEINMYKGKKLDYDQMIWFIIKRDGWSHEMKPKERESDKM